MRQTRFWKLQALFLVVPMLLVLLLASNQAQGQTSGWEGQGGPPGDGPHPALPGLHAPVDHWYS